MDTYDKIKMLTEAKGMNIKDLEKELGFGNGSIGKMKGKENKYIERLRKLADFLSVPVGYLVDDIEEDVLMRDFNEVFFEGKALASYLGEIGWTVEFVNKKNSTPYYIFKNDNISMNVSASDYDILNENVRGFCEEKIFDMVKRSASPIKLAAARPNANPNAGDSDSPENDIEKI